MLLSYSGYLRMSHKKDSFDTFEHFICLCLERDLNGIERQDAKWLYQSYRFANEYRLEVKK